MKRAGRLFDAVLDRDNLRLAVHKALKGKRGRADACAWISRLDANLDRLTEQLALGTVPVGRFYQFVTHDPKERIITAPCFEERVLHHALMNVCEPHLERWLIFDTYACRKGKGRNAALLRARQNAARYRFFLKMDVRKYFDSVPHQRLLELWQRRFKDDRLNRLVDSIVRSYRGVIGLWPADWQSDLATPGELLPGLVRPLRQGEAADSRLRPLHGRPGFVGRRDGDVASGRAGVDSLSPRGAESNGQGPPLPQPHHTRHGFPRLPGIRYASGPEPSQSSAVSPLVAEPRSCLVGR